MSKETNRPWAWIPSLYYIEGLPYVVVMTVAVILYKRLGVSNSDIALFTSLLYLPWVIKPLWSPFVDLVKTKRFWTVNMQLIVGLLMAAVAFVIPQAPSLLSPSQVFQITLGLFALMAFASATHDVAADGFYLLALKGHQQAFFVGIRSTFYRIAMITGQGLIVILAGYLEARTSPDTASFTTLWQPNTESSFSPAEEAEGKSLSLIIENEAISLVDGTEGQADSVAVYNALAEMKAAGLVDAELSLPNLSSYKALVLNRVALSQPPEEQLVVMIDKTEGPAEWVLLGPSRYTFTPANGKETAQVIIGLTADTELGKQARFEVTSGNIPFAWSTSFFVLAALMVLAFFWHKIILPKPLTDRPSQVEDASIWAGFLEVFRSFFARKDIGIILAFLLTYRLGESQLVKLATPFLLDGESEGGLSLTTSEVGILYGTIGVLCLVAGGLIGGVLASRFGLQRLIWFMLLAINVPNAVYIYLAYAQPENLALVGTCIGIEQLGYGFGFTGYMLYMIYVSQGKHQTAHFAITTGFMALGMMIPGMISGFIQESLGYPPFFVWVLLATLPSFLVVAKTKIDPAFGRKSTEKDAS